MNSVNSKKPALRLAALAFAFVACTATAALAESRSITVTGQGEAFAKPDQAAVNAGIQTFAETVVQATRQNQAVVEKIFAALAEQDIPDKDIQTSNYSIWAEQDHHESRQGRIVGFRVSNIVSVTIGDIDKVGEVLAAVTNAGANTIHGIQFGVKEPAALEEKAREAAMRDARARAEALAQLAGVQLGEILTISTSSGPISPGPMARRSMEMADAAPAPGIAPGEQSVSVWIEARYAIR
ncbi:MAG: SIMPL domain-containing protein [Woeseia sp.]